MAEPLSERDLAEKLKSFQCRRCNQCCKQPGFVYLTPSESDSIAAFLNRDVYAFVNEACDIQDRQRLVLKKNPDESCIFLTENGCSIHAVKPGQCRDFPVRWRTPRSFEYCEGLKALFPRPES